MLLRTGIRTVTQHRTMGLFNFTSSSSATTSSGPTLSQQRAMSSKSQVDSAIAENDIVIFSKSYCPYCSKTKTLAQKLASEKNKTLKIFELDEIDEGSEFQSYLLEKTKQRTVPNVWIKQQHIGGNDDFQAAHRAGKVTTLLA